jgi:acyl-CoA thioesterase II
VGPEGSTLAGPVRHARPQTGCQSNRGRVDRLAGVPQSVGELIDLLELEEIEIGLFRARQPDTQLQRVFGGQVLAQAVMAASRTVVVTRVLHSLHGYFLIPGRTDTPIVYEVEAVRDGGSFSSRRVVARQGGRVIFYLSSSFHKAEAGYEHADPAPIDVPAPDSCPRLSDVLAKVAGREPSFWEREWGALDVRYVGDSRPGGALADDLYPARARVWIKANGSLPDERRMHQAALAYASDLTLLAVTTVPHGVFVGLNVQAASIDHALWFHRPFRADDWLLFDQASPSASGGLGLSTARLFQQEALVADVAQEGLIRPNRQSTASRSSPDVM